MSSPDDLFAGGGDFAPSFKFANIGDSVAGEILSTAVQDQTAYDDPTKILLDRNGQPKKQLQVILQTSLRGWQQVAKIPTDPDTKQPLPPEKDDGRRAIYVKGWMVGAVGGAVEKATGSRGAPRVGGKLAVRYSGDRDTGKGNPLKLFEAVYQPPAVGEDIFSEAPQPQAPMQNVPPHPQQPAFQAPQQQFAGPVQASQQPVWGQQAPAAQQAPAGFPPAQPPSNDPWANFGTEPPF